MKIRMMLSNLSVEKVKKIKYWTKEYLKQHESIEYEVYDDINLLYQQACQLKREEPIIFWIDMLGRDKRDIDVAKAIATGHRNSSFIFSSVSADMVEDFFDLELTCLFIKPVTFHRFRKAIDKAFYKLKPDYGKVLSISYGKSKLAIPIKDIYYIESDLRKIRIHCGSTYYETYEKISCIEQAMGEDFIRCHKSYLVHRRYIREINKKDLILDSGVIIPVSRQRYKATLQEFMEYRQLEISEE